jgi:hypothetical protein
MFFSIFIGHEAYAATDKNVINPAYMQNIIKSFLFDSIQKAVDDNYETPHQIYKLEIQSIWPNPNPNSTIYEITVMLETFTGAHNQPYGRDTVVFWFNSLLPKDSIWVKQYNHEQIECLY